MRLRMVQAFLGDRTLTPTQLQKELQVPPATLYRHVAAMVDAGVLAVVAERQARGAVERTYALNLSAAQVPAEDLRRMSPKQHRGAFWGFVAGLLADFDAYTERGDIDFVRDLVGCRQVSLNLTAEETVQLIAELNAVIVPWLSRRPASGRTRRSFSTVLIPVGDGDASADAAEAGEAGPQDTAGTDPAGASEAGPDDTAETDPGNAGEAQPRDPVER